MISMNAKHPIFLTLLCSQCCLVGAFKLLVFHISGSCLASLWLFPQQKVEILKPLSIPQEIFLKCHTVCLTDRCTTSGAKLATPILQSSLFILEKLAFSLQILVNISGRCFNWHSIS